MTTAKKGIRRYVRVATASVVAAIGIASSPAWSATKTWDGGNGSSQSWATQSNWDVDASPAPASGDTLIFAGTNNVGTAGARLTGNTNFANLTFANSTSGFFLGGTQTPSAAMTITQSSDSAESMANSIEGKDITLTLTGTGTGTVTMSGLLTDASTNQNLTVLKTGSSQFVLAGTNTYKLTTTVAAGTLVAGTNAPSGANGAFGNATSAVLVGDTSGSAAASLLIGGAFTVGRAVTLQAGNTGTMTLGGNTAAASAFTGNIILNRPVTLTAASGGSVNFSTGTWTTNNNAVTVTGSGTSNVTLSNTLNTTAAVNINSGTFTVNGTLSGGGSAVEVNSGGKLAGNGTVSKTVNLNSGGAISPKGEAADGTNVGTLATNGQTWNAGATYVWEIKDAGTSGGTVGAGSSYDTLSVTGAINLSNLGGSNKFTIEVVRPGTGVATTGFNASQNWTWIIATGSSNVVGFTSSADQFILNTSDFVSDNPSAVASNFKVDVSGGAVRVTYTVPEPTSSVLASVGAVAMLRRRRRSR